MPKKITTKRAQAKKRKGNSASSQAGEYVKETIHNIRKGKHGARSPEQAIAIGLSKARKAGVKIPQRQSAGKGESKSAPKVSRKRSQASLKALKREPKSTVSHDSLSRYAHKIAQRRGPNSLHKSAMKAARSRSMRSH